MKYHALFPHNNNNNIKKKKKKSKMSAAVVIAALSLNDTELCCVHVLAIWILG